MTNEDKILTLIEKMYTEFTGRFEKIETNIATIEANMVTIEMNMSTKEDLNTVKQSLARIEQDQGIKIAALFDAREVQSDENEHINNTLDRMENKFDKLLLRVAHHDDLLRKVR